MIRAIVFDFDDTLCNINTFNIRESDIRIISIYSLFNTYEKTYKLLIQLKKAGIILCIASFGRYNTIKYLTDKAFPNIFDRIYTPDNLGLKTRFIPDNNCKCISTKYQKSGYSKNVILRLISNKFYITDLKNILFFDDDNANTDCAKTIGVIAFNNKKPLDYDIIREVFTYYHSGPHSKKYVLRR